MCLGPLQTESEKWLTPCLCEGWVCSGLHWHGPVAHSGCGEVSEAGLPSHCLSCWASSITERVLDHSLWQKREEQRERHERVAMEQSQQVNAHLVLCQTQYQCPSCGPPRKTQSGVTAGIKSRKEAAQISLVVITTRSEELLGYCNWDQVRYILVGKAPVTVRIRIRCQSHQNF